MMVFDVNYGLRFTKMGFFSENLYLRFRCCNFRQPVE